MPATRKVTVVLLPTLTEPVWTTLEEPFGPVTVQPIELICSPPGRVSCIPTEPVASAGTPLFFGDSTFSGATAPVDEQPIWALMVVAAPQAPIKSALRTIVFLVGDLIGASSVDCSVRARLMCKRRPKRLDMHP
jgi:hypothetical protein